MEDDCVGNNCRQHSPVYRPRKQILAPVAAFIPRVVVVLYSRTSSHLNLGFTAKSLYLGAKGSIQNIFRS